ncbi:hypothetical protein GCM10011578_032050 [Streptomyces fuscichromogenes]|uniref:Uncharacterized protein n=1 Tax=Streptomyces fuscichromogenes TaxID=1324013 RepID=A0A917XCA0_9ACTN|nr:hypothetical protein GCM10011578_032050 [Streptomyces fuscichromogenes]
MRRRPYRGVATAKKVKIAKVLRRSCGGREVQDVENLLPARGPRPVRGARSAGPVNSLFTGLNWENHRWAAPLGAAGPACSDSRVVLTS